MNRDASLNRISFDARTKLLIPHDDIAAGWFINILTKLNTGGLFHDVVRNLIGRVLGRSRTDVELSYTVSFFSRVMILHRHCLPHAEKCIVIALVAVYFEHDPLLLLHHSKKASSAWHSKQQSVLTQAQVRPAERHFRALQRRYVCELCKGIESKWLKRTYVGLVKSQWMDSNTSDPYSKM